MYLPHDVYTVESVTSGHPDKVCDQISDAILDAYLASDSLSRVAVEAFGSHGLLVIGGEVTSQAIIDAASIAKKIYHEIGYKDDLKVITNIVSQSPDIAQGVDTGGAGDQGIMYGYATDETEQFLPKGIVLVHEMTRRLEKARVDKKLPWLGPDGKAQITIQNKVVKTILVSTQHDSEISDEQIKKGVIEHIVKPVLDTSGVEILVNPTGRFVQGGFEADTGLTGRKIMVDTYGGLIPHGGGCFSGKDPTKVDRSAAYMCRFVAKNVVAHGLGKECLVAVSYAIGKAEPLMVWASNEKGEDLSSVAERYDFRPNAIIKRFNLRRPIYRKTAAYGHFSNPDLPWEQVVSKED